MDASIRLLTEREEPFLWTALYHALYIAPDEEALPHDIVARPDIARYVRGWMQRPDDLGFVAEKANQAIGAAWLRRWSPDEAGYGFVDERTPEVTMAVLPGYRGRGVGTRLLRQLLSAAAERFDAVSLSVAMVNPARRLYEREGFVPVGEPRSRSLTMMKVFRP